MFIGPAGFSERVTPRPWLFDQVPARWWVVEVLQGPVTFADAVFKELDQTLTADQGLKSFDHALAPT